MVSWASKSMRVLLRVVLTVLLVIVALEMGIKFAPRASLLAPLVPQLGSAGLGRWPTQARCEMREARSERREARGERRRRRSEEG